MALEAKVSGYGPKKLLILHGWLSDHHVFDQVAPFFRQSHYTLAFMDFRGYGLNRAKAGTYAVDEIANDALDLCETLGWRNYHVLGHSMGGMVTQKMALLKPGRITSALAVTPVPASGFPLDEGTAQFFTASADDDTTLTAIFNTLTGERHPASLLEGLTAGARAAIARDAYLGYLKTWTTTDFSNQVAKIDLPVHVIAGARDKALGPAFLQNTYLKQLPNVQMSVMDHCGHYPMLESPPEFFDLVERALNRA